MSNIASDLFVKYNCTNCQDDITGIRVHCAECSSIDLCLQCFAAGAMIGEHRNSHAYQFMDTGILSIYRGKGAWSAREELHLLNAIAKYGFNNWEDISKHIETRSAEDAKEEYVSKFFKGTIGRHTWTPVQSQMPKLEDHTIEEDTGPLGSSVIQKLPPLDITSEEAAQLGYMPNRDDFERPYDPTAEHLVSSLTLEPEDVETDLVLKLAQVDMYTRRLRERARRKRLVRDYQLAANYFRGNNIKSRTTRDQREFRDRFRVFAQFYTAHEYERLLASIERERELRIRLSELNRYRWNGLTRIDECVHFEQHAAVDQHKNTGPYGHGRTDNPTTGNRHGSYSHLPHNKKAETPNGNERSSNFIVQKHTHLIGDQIYSDGSSLNKNYWDSYRGLSGPSNNPMMVPSTIAQISYQAHQQHQQSGNTVVVGNIRNQNNNNNSSSSINNSKNSGELGENLQQQQQQQQQNQQPPQQQQQQQNQQSQQQQQQQQQSLQRHGENLLSTNEIQLCNLLNLPPTRYITLKTVLLSGAPISSNSSTIENVIRKYLIKAGWLSH